MHEGLQTLLEWPAIYSRVADVAMINAVSGVIRHSHLIWAGRRLHWSDFSGLPKKLENQLNLGVIEGVDRLGSIPPLKSWWGNCIVLRGVLGFRGMGVAVIAMAPHPLVGPRGLVFEVELDLKFGPVPSLG